MSDEQLKAAYAASQQRPGALPSQPPGYMNKLEVALQNAHAAGDTSAARALAGEIIKVRGASPLASMSDEQLKAAYYASQPKPQGFMANAADFAKSIPRGVMSNLGSAASFAGESPVPMPDELLASNSDKMAALDKNFDLHKPQGRAGQFGAAIGETLGNPLSYAGPGSLALRVGAGVAGAVGSEGAGQAAEGTNYEIPARLAGGLAGGLLAGKVAGLNTPRVANATVEDLKDAASAGYQHPDVAALQIHPAAATQLSQNIESTLLKNGVDDIVAPQTAKIIDRLKAPRFGPSTTIEDLDGARKALGNVAPAEMRAAAIARKEIDNYLGNVPQSDLIAGNAAKANAILLDARANYAAASRAEEVQRALNNADINASSAYSGGNLNNATRQTLKPLLKRRENFSAQGYSPEEIDQLSRAVRGTFTGNVARGLGKMGPNGGLMGAGHLTSAYMTGGATVPASLGFGAAKILGDRSTARQAAKLNDMLLARSPVGKQIAAAQTARTATNASTTRAALIAALLSQTGRSQGGHR